MVYAVEFPWLGGGLLRDFTYFLISWIFKYASGRLKFSTHILHSGLGVLMPYTELKNVAFSIIV